MIRRLYLPWEVCESFAEEINVVSGSKRECPLIEVKLSFDRSLHTRLAGEDHVFSLSRRIAKRAMGLREQLAR
jgi:hypothetical protein